MRDKYQLEREKITGRRTEKENAREGGKKQSETKKKKIVCEYQREVKSKTVIKIKRSNSFRKRKEKKKT